MAHSLNTSPVIIDSAAAIPQQVRPLAGDPASAGKAYIIHIRWVCDTNSQSVAGDKAQIVSLSTTGNTLWEATATGANYEEDSRIEQWWDIEGFKVQQLSHGKLYIYIK